MKKILFRKNIKFSMILSIVSFMGMQTGEAIEVSCPSAEDVKITQQEDGLWMYEGTSTERPFHFKTPEPLPVKIPLKNKAPRGGGITGETKRCVYSIEKRKGYHSILLETDDPAAKVCGYNPATPSVFHCPDDMRKKEKK